MRKLIATLAIIALVGSPAAMAQNGKTSGPAATSKTSTGGTRGVGDAPIGHRQPRPDKIPSASSETNDSARLDAEDARVDRKIKSICRGC